MPRENFTESFISSLRYANHSPRIKTILFRDLIFALVISIVPALLPVVSLKELHLSAAQLGLVFTCVGVGSLFGAIVLLPYLRQHISPNATTSISMTILVLVLVALAVTRQLPVLLTGATLAGMAWALAGSELWVAGQRVMPGWVRGRMDALQIMLGQGGMALGAFLWGAGISHADPEWTFAAAAVLALSVLILGGLFSINFPADLSLNAAPGNPLHDFPAVPPYDAGPVTITIAYLVEESRRDEFRRLMEEVQAVCRRNGAFHCRLDRVSRGSGHISPGVYRRNLGRAPSSKLTQDCRGQPTLRCRLEAEYWRCGTARAPLSSGETRLAAPRLRPFRPHLFQQTRFATPNGSKLVGRRVKQQPLRPRGVMDLSILANFVTWPGQSWRKWTALAFRHDWPLIANAALSPLIAQSCRSPLLTMAAAPHQVSVCQARVTP